MHAWMLAMLGRKRVRTVLTFTENATWTAPLTTNQIGLTGKGAPGFPGETGASTVAFGKVFQGGTSGFATEVTHPVIPVVPGDPYQLQVAGGGYVIIAFDS